MAGFAIGLLLSAGVTRVVYALTDSAAVAGLVGTALFIAVWAAIEDHITNKETH